MNDWWQNAFHFCVLGLGMRPKEFWMLTLPELNLLAQSIQNFQPSNLLSRAELEELQSSFPDTPGVKNNA